MIESPADRKVVVRYADKFCRLNEGFTRAKVDLRNCDGPAADYESLYVRFQDGWTPKEAIVDAVCQNSSPTGGRRRESPPLSNNVRVCKHKVETSKSGERRADPSRFNVTTASYSERIRMAKKVEQDKGPSQPPKKVMPQFDPQQRKSFSRLRSRIPEHLRMIQSGLDKAAWQP